MVLAVRDGRQSRVSVPRIIYMESCPSFSNLSSVKRGVMSSRVVCDHSLRHWFILSLDLLVLGLASDEVLFELIVAGSTLKSSQQVLTVNILNNRSLADAC